MTVSSLAPVSPQVPAPAVPPRRLDWLDGLRGLAALVVVFEHTVNVLFPEIRQSASPWFDFGRYGVFVFFLVSGYIVPASLERRRSVREFWIGRLFRLYPLAAVASVIALLLAFTAVAWAPHHGVTERPGIVTLAHLTMLQDLLGAPSVINVFWTLSYEMVFYLLITALFAAGIRVGPRGDDPPHPPNGSAVGKASAGAALTFATGAATVGILLPVGLLAAWSQAGTTVVAAVLMAVGLLAVMSGNRAARRFGCVLLAGLALVLLAFNNRIGGMESLAIIGTMFAGSALYEIEQGRLRKWRGIAMVALVPVLTVVGGVRMALHGDGTGQPSAEWGWTAAVVAAWLTFLLGMAVRHHRFPRPLPWLGVVSYSIYLLHPPVVQVAWRLVGDPETWSVPERIAWGAAVAAAVLAAAALGHRYVELPMQRMGRRVARGKPGDRQREPVPSAPSPGSAEREPVLELAHGNAGR